MSANRTPVRLKEDWKNQAFASRSHARCADDRLASAPYQSLLFSTGGRNTEKKGSFAMTTPSDSFAHPARSQEHLPPSSFSHHLDETLDARMRRLTSAYYSGRFKYQLLEQLVRQEQNLGENLPDHDQPLSHTSYPTLAQYLAYLCRLDAERGEAPQTDREPDH